MFNENHDLAIARSTSSRADPGLRVAFKCLNILKKTAITHLSQTDRFYICYRTETLKDTAFYSLGFLFSKSMSKQIYLRKAAEYLDDKQIEDDMEVPIDRFLLPKDLQTMLEVFITSIMT